MILSHFTGRIRGYAGGALQSGISVMWSAGDKHARYLPRQGLDTYCSICLLSDQIPRLMVISLSFVVYVIHVHLCV